MIFLTINIRWYNTFYSDLSLIYGTAKTSTVCTDSITITLLNDIRLELISHSFYTSVTLVPPSLILIYVVIRWIIDLKLQKYCQ